MPRRVLIIEDDQDLVALTQLHLEEAGMEVVVATDGDAGAEAIAEGGYDLVLLDLGLPGIDGLDLCRRVRARAGYVPMIIVTARGEEFDRVLGLELGADDYLVKPVGFRELVARVRAQFRRAEAPVEPPEHEGKGELRWGAVTVEPRRRRASVSGQALDLTAKEFDLLAHFLRHPGQVFSRSDLLENVWGQTFAGYEHTVNSHMNRLRKKLGAGRGAIETVWGVGYRLAEEAFEPGHTSAVGIEVDSNDRRKTVGEG